MKFTLDWLKDHLDTSENLNTITDTLTNIGLEIESVEDKSEIFKNFTVARVLKTEKHPDADKLKVCQVETINGNYQVVCGAPNAKEGMLGIFAPENSYIPGTDLHLKKTKIRDIVCGGGVFMNVKANMLIQSLPEVKSMYVMPSGGDESLSIGAALHYYYNLIH